MKKQEQAIKNCLINNGEKFYQKLVALYPEHEKVIKYHYQQTVPFEEWFAFLFNNHKWVLDGPTLIPMNHITVSQTRYKIVAKDFETEEYKSLLVDFDITKVGYITVVKPDDKYQIVDGYHRFYIHDQNNLVTIEAYEWIKKENPNPISNEISKLVIDNLKM